MKVDLASTHLFITQNVIDIFKKYRQLGKRSNEMGGIILGQVNQNSENVLICRASIPNLSDRFGRLFFNRNKGIAQIIIDYENLNSQGFNTYLGEWHTHPSNKAEPSSQDINMIKEQFFKNEIKINFIFLVIVGQKELNISSFNGVELVSKSVEMK